MTREADEDHAHSLFFSGGCRGGGLNVSAPSVASPYGLANRQHAHASPILRVFPEPLFLTGS